MGEVGSSVVGPAGGVVRGRSILADDRPSRRSVACSLHRGLGESALLCLFDARFVRVDGAGGGDEAGLGGGPGSLLGLTAVGGGLVGSPGSVSWIARRF